MLDRIAHRRHKPRNQGFTLFEVLLAVVLVSVGVLALSYAFSLGLSASGNSESLLVASQLAQEKMEELRNKSYSNISSQSRAAVSGFSTYEREVVVTVPQTNLKQVSVKVYWYNKSDELNTSVVTYVSNI